jgi:antitoxin component of MazEF toxin-antitoxin module
MAVIYKKIKPNREIELPEEVMKRLHLKVGEKIALSVKNRRLLIKPAKSVVDEVVGAAKLKDTKIIDKIIEDTEFKE